MVRSPATSHDPRPPPYPTLALALALTFTPTLALTLALTSPQVLSFPSLLNVGSLLALVLFIYAVLGVNIFTCVPTVAC